MARSRNRNGEESPPPPIKSEETKKPQEATRRKSVASLGVARRKSSANVNSPFRPHDFPSREISAISHHSGSEKFAVGHDTSVWEVNTSRFGSFTSHKSAAASKRRTMAIGEMESLSQELRRVSVANTNVFEFEEELQPTQPNGPLSDVVAYVECYCSAENRSICIANELRALGATVSPTFTTRVTHVVFKDGRQATIERARQRNVHVVSVLWVDSCKSNRTKMSESLFSVSETSAQGTPILVGRSRKQKSMQPKPFEHELAMSSERIVKRKRRVERVKQLKDLAGYGPDSPLESGDLCSQPLLDPTTASVGSKSICRVPSWSSFEEPSTPDSMRLKLDDLREKIMKITNTSPFSSQDQSPTSASPTSSQALSEAISKRLFNSKGKIFGSPPPLPLMERLALSAARDKSMKPSMENCSDSPSEDSLGSRSSVSVESVRAHYPDATEGKSFCSGGVNTSDSRQSLPERSNLFDIIGTESFDGMPEDEDIGEDRTTPFQENVPFFVPQTQEFEMGKSRSFANKFPPGASLMIIPETVPSDNEDDFPGFTDDNISVDEVLGTQYEQDQNPIVEAEIPAERVVVWERKPTNSNGQMSKKASVVVDESETVGTSTTLGSLLTKRSLKKDVAGVPPEPKCKAEPLREVETGAVESAVPKRMLMNTKQRHRPLSLLDSPNPSDVTPVSKRLTERTLQRGDVPQIFGVSQVGKADKTAAPATISEKTATEATKAKGRRLRSSMFEMKPGLVDRNNSDDFKEPIQKSKSLRDSDDAAVLPKKKQKRAVTPERSIVLTSLHTPQRESATKVIKRLGGYTVAQQVNQQTSHVVSGEPRRTLNVLYGLSYGCWVVSLDWVIQSARAQRWLSEDEFEMKEDFPAASEHREMTAGQQGRNLFASVGRMYISDRCNPPQKDLKLLVELNGGEVVSVPRKAQLCVRHLTSATKSSPPSVTEKWILDCITGNRLLPIDTYLDGS